jgi:hypothetical protein
MEFSGFDLEHDKVAKAWPLIDLKRPEIDEPELKGVSAMLDRLVLLYAQGAAFAGEIEFPEVAALRNEIDPNAFKEFHEKFISVLTNLEGQVCALLDILEWAAAFEDLRWRPTWVSYSWSSSFLTAES